MPLYKLHLLTVISYSYQGFKQFTPIQHHQQDMEQMRMAFVIVFFVLCLAAVNASDPELVKDFAENSTKIDPNFFTFTGFRGGVTAPKDQFLVRKASLAELPALEGLGVSLALLSFQPGAVNSPHTHPRGTELLYVEQGCLTVGLIDTTNKLFVQKLEKGDVFVFPKGLVHFQMNEGAYEAKAVSAFSSSSAGTVSIPGTVFGSDIDDAVLSKAFKVSPKIIKLLKSAQVPK